MPQQKNIVILISGGGSNMAAIVKAAHAEHWLEKHGVNIALVVSNRPQAKGLEVAHKLGVSTQVVDHEAFASRELFDRALLAAIEPLQPALVVLAGFMRILTSTFVNHYTGRLINIHPSLLPLFPGLNTHQRALDAGCKEVGATVHQVTTELDHGTVLEQVAVTVQPGETAQALAAKVLLQEHVIYPHAVRKFFGIS